MSDTNKRDELVTKLLNLHERLAELKRTKRSMAKDYKDQINDVEDEIESVIEELGEGKGVA